MSTEQHPVRFSGRMTASVALLLLLTAVFILHTLATARIDAAHELRQRSFLLATELRQSSDDLTRMVRTYVVTGKPVFKQHYQDILDIRNGDKARPMDYGTVNWDRRTPASNVTDTRGGSKVALLELMRRAGFVPDEFLKLEVAKRHSDELTGMEVAAMRLVESGGADLEAKRRKALLMLMDETYLQAKESIMKPIGEFSAMVDARTFAAVQAATSVATALTYLFVAVGLGLVFMLRRTYRALSDTLGGSVDEVGAAIATIGRGDFSASLQPEQGAEHSVLGWLEASRAELRERARERNAAEEARSRLVAIVQSSDDAIIGKTTEGVITSWNRGAEKIFGHAAEEAIGQPAQILFPAERREEETEILARIRRGEVVSHFDTVRVRKDGQLTAVSMIVSPIKDDSGQIVGASMIARDIGEQRRKEEELRQSEARFRSLVTATSQIVWHASVEGKVSGPLPSWQQYTGQTVEEVQDIGWTRALHPDDVPHTMAVWMKAVETCSLYEVDYRIRRLDGVYRLFTVRGAPVLNDDGSVREWVGTCADITDRRQAELERDRFFAVGLDLMCIASPDGYFKRVNPAFERTLGYTAEDLLSRPFMDFIHPDDVAGTQAVVATLAEGIELVNFENRYRCKDGSYRWFLWTCVPADGLLYATARDITDRKQAEAEIRALNDSLEQRVVERTAQLEAANKELEAFSYSVSHDLRAPLRGIDSFSRMVIEDYGSKLDADGQRQLNVIRSEAQRMGQLIDELLNFSRLGRQEVRSARVDMSALVRSVFDELSAPARARVREFKVHPLPDAYGDRAMIRQVLVNLIDNAVKYSSKVPDPIIEISGDTVDGSTTYRVKDNGIGFDPRYGHKLFGVFQRLHAEHEFEGVGVGLAIVQRVIHRHGGIVSAAGVPDHGATFSFTLPAQNTTL